MFCDWCGSKIEAGKSTLQVDGKMMHEVCGWMYQCKERDKKVGILRNALEEIRYRTNIDVREGTIYFRQPSFGVQCCRIILTALETTEPKRT